MSIPHLVHEVLTVLDHELDGGVLELLSVVEVGQDEALQARVHGEVVAQGLLVKLKWWCKFAFSLLFSQTKTSLAAQNTIPDLRLTSQISLSSDSWYLSAASSRRGLRVLRLSILPAYMYLQWASVLLHPDLNTKTHHITL